MNQNKRIIDYINDFGSITIFDACADLGIAHLANHIYELKEQGYRFKQTVESRTNRYGDKVIYTRYSLDD